MNKMKCIATSPHWIIAILALCLGGFNGCSLPTEQVGADTRAGAGIEPQGCGEDDCSACNPELERGNDTALVISDAPRDPSRLWCRAHSVYEDECFLCHPELAERALDPAAHGGLYCTEHDLPENECGNCHPELVPTLKLGEGLKLRLGSEKSADKAGIQTGHPSPGTLRNGIEVLGQTRFNLNNLAYLTPLAGGVVKRVLVDVGDLVEAGDLLAELQSSEVAAAKSALLAALSGVELRRVVLARETRLVDQRISAHQDLQEAKAAFEVGRTELEQARQRLLNLGLTEDEVALVSRERSASSALLVRAPFAGTVIERTAVLGEAVDEATPLFRIADLEKMWMELSLPEHQMHSVAPGASVTATFSALPGHSFPGILVWIEPSVDEKTRMLRARAVLENAGGLLKSHLFGSATIESSSDETALLIPADAVQTVDGVPLVFAKLGSDLFEGRPVAFRQHRDGLVGVLSGLRASDEIAVSESYLLKAELLKARLGAGCAEH